MKLKKINKKKNSIQVKRNQNNEDHNWNKKKMEDNS